MGEHVAIVIGRLVRWIDDRLGASRFTRSTLNKVFPDHWSFMLGEVALYCFVVLVLTGTFLTFFFQPSAKEVVYHGHYAPLNGVRMSDAFRSTVHISFDVRAGLVIRQIHHWAALIFVAAIVTHLCRVFFTGAFRRPRELNWLVGVTLLVLAIFNGFTGYSIPDDLLSGTGLRIAYSVVLSIPLAGTWIAFLIFGGEFPTPNVIARLFVIHILIVPALLAGLLTAHMAILWHQKHTQFPGRGRREDNIEGSRLWPTYAIRSVGLLFLVFAVVAALGGLAQINPIWLYGPFRPDVAAAGSQPDWYVGWLEGALRLFPNWEVRGFGHTVPNPFFPGVVLPGVTFTLLYLWPFSEARVTGDRSSHHLLDRPRDAPLRTAIGTAVLAFYVILVLAGGNDVLANFFHLSLESTTRVFRVALFAVPLLAGLVAYRLCRELSSTGVRPLRGPVGTVVSRTAEGGYEEAGESGQEAASDSAR